jgi:hypothetical protein
MFALALQIFFGKEHLVENRLISAPDKVIYFKRNTFSGVDIQNLSSQNRVEIS